VQRYYFHLKDGHESLDDLGSEFPDIQAARREAVKYSGEVLRARVLRSGKASPGNVRSQISLTARERRSSL
jgi:hypothetical protein